MFQFFKPLFATKITNFTNFRSKALNFAKIQFFKPRYFPKNQFFKPLFLVPTRSLSPHLRPFGPHTYTKRKVKYPPIILLSEWMEWPKTFNEPTGIKKKKKKKHYNHITIMIIIVGFFIPVSSLKVFGHSIHSERRRIYLGKSIQALQNDTIIISWVFSFRVIQLTVRWHILKTFMFVFINFCSSKNLFETVGY